MVQTRDESRAAMLVGGFGYMLWGVLPVYFHVLEGLGLGTAEMIAHRTLWALFWAGGVIWLAGQKGEVWRTLRSPRLMTILAASTGAILVNWTVYVAAVNAGHVLEASLGYYINPLMNMAVGAWLLREKISRGGQIAIGLASVGVAIQTVALGHLPLTSLGLAVSFCLYGFIRKQAPVSAQTGLFIECLYVFLPGLAYVTWLQSTGAGHLFASPLTFGLLLCAGPATVAPLALFAWAARRLPMTALGFLQFIAPTLQFLVGLALGEAFTPMRALSFGFIWAGVAVFAVSGWMRGRRSVQVAA
ncbi:MAG: RarD protein superfamily transporter [Caulobacteraceae bacterium]|nr:RarD protein superfamily transporter [Caulobacteraceae bacterium]